MNVKKSPRERPRKFPRVLRTLTRSAFPKRESARHTSATFVAALSSPRQALAIVGDRAGLEPVHKRLQIAQTILQEAEKLADLGVWEFDPANGYIHYSDSFAKIFGLPRKAGSISVSKLAASLGPECGCDLEGRLRKIAGSSKSSSRRATFAVYSPDVRNRRTFCAQVPGDKGQPARVVGVTQDITVAKAAEDELRRLSHRLITAQNDERRRIARNLHETTSQTLGLLKLTLGKIERSLPATAKDAAETVKTARELVEGALREVRSVSALLYPPLLEEAGLPPAIRAYALNFAERAGLKVKVSISDMTPRLPREIEITIFRMIQESLTNIYRHAHASRCFIRVRRSTRNVSVIVRDNGTGIRNATKHGPLNVGVGIAGMRERIKQLHGTFHIKKAGALGTIVNAEIPLGPPTR